MAHAAALGALFPPQVILAASASTAQRGALVVVDPASGPLVHLKGVAHALRNGVSFAPSATHAAGDSGTGGLVATIEHERAVLVVHSFQRDQPLCRIVLPGRMRAASLAPSGTYIATGAPDGRLFVWEVASGALLCSFEAHYRAITALRWTSDSAALISASADSRICVWSLPSLLGASDLGAAHVPSPYAALADHTLEVTDLVVPAGAFPTTKLWSASADLSIKVWDLATRRLVSTFALPSAPTCLAVDPLERFVVAGADTRLFRVDLYDPDAVRARGGRGAEGEVVRTDGLATLVLADAVTAVGIDAGGSHIAAGTSGGQLHIADAASLQVHRVHSANTAPTHSPHTPVTNVHFLARPADLLGGMHLWAAAGTKRSAAMRDALAAQSTHVVPLPPPHVATQFQRTVVRGGELPRVMLRIGDGRGGSAAAGRYVCGGRAADAGAADAGALAATAPAATAPAAAAGAAPTPLDAAPQSTSTSTLSAELARARALNDDMWRHVVRLTMAP